MKYGIIGAGRIAPAYLSLARNFPGITCVAIADRNLDTAEAMAAEWDIQALTIEMLLARTDVETVLNLTPIPVHFEVSRAILAAGKHLYSEKPLAETLAQSRDLLDLTRDGVLLLACAPDTFLGAAPQLARRLIEGGRIGEIVAASATFVMDGAHFSQRFFGTQIGPLRELGPYYLTALVHLLGPVTHLTGFSHNPVRQRSFGGDTMDIETPTDIRALLQFESGVMADFSASVDVVATGRAPLEIQGTEGTLLLPDPNFFGGDVVLMARDGTREVFPTSELPLGHLNWGDGRLANYRSVGLADMAAALKDKRPPRAGGSMAMHVAEIIEQLLVASMEIRPIVSRFDRPTALSPDEASSLLDPLGAQ